MQLEKWDLDPHLNVLDPPHCGFGRFIETTKSIK